ncbi:MAG: helix-turn-helix transcriptional regulator [Acidobacteriaceae bacterium]
MATKSKGSGQEKPEAAWTFLTNHAHVLLLLSNDAEMRMRDAAAAVGITERAVQRIVDDLAAAGHLSIEKDGRRNRYTVHAGMPLRHPVEAHCSVGGLIRFVLSGPPKTGKRKRVVRPG